MQKIGLFQAKQKLSELIERASEGEKIGITRREKLAALIVPATPELCMAKAFARIDQIRKRVKPLPKGMTIKDLMEQGRR